MPAYIHAKACTDAYTITSSSCMHTHIHAYICMHTYIHAYIHRKSVPMPQDTDPEFPSRVKHTCLYVYMSTLQACLCAFMYASA